MAIDQTQMINYGQWTTTGQTPMPISWYNDHNNLCGDYWRACYPTTRLNEKGSLPPGDGDAHTNHNASS